MSTLRDAARLVETARAQRLLAGDHDTAQRYGEIVRHLHDEDELLDNIVVHDLPVPRRWYPPGSTIGYLFQHDSHVRELRRLRGLRVPEVAA